MGGLGHRRGSLDQAEVGHRIGERAGQEVQPPIQFFLAQPGHAAADRLGEFTQHMAVLIGQELAQVVVALGVSAGNHADEGATTVAVLGHRERRFDERRQ